MAISIYFSSLSMKPGDIISIPFAFMADKDDEVFLMLTSNFSFSSSSSSSYVWLGMDSSSKLVGSKMTSIKWKWDNCSLESSVFLFMLVMRRPKRSTSFEFHLHNFKVLRNVSHYKRAGITLDTHTHTSLAVNLVSKYGYAINIRILEQTLEC